ncbi:hypothetical protein BDA99DRAFT_540896 [Phascolomyces articulosus]|uniref:Uncharacterized protein n=1 Tax=Phascolomyces articulosus TaxID=60185 RepID=A0AAD5K6D9_9FUNG|nr:hypothetical protein BDA99DRAFT_540896 [Phascolomyces articulosus]
MSLNTLIKVDFVAISTDGNVRKAAHFNNIGSFCSIYEPLFLHHLSEPMAKNPYYYLCVLARIVVVKFAMLLRIIYGVYVPIYTYSAYCFLTDITLFKKLDRGKTEKPPMEKKVMLDYDIQSIDNGDKKSFDPNLLQ